MEEINRHLRAKRVVLYFIRIGKKTLRYIFERHTVKLLI